RDPRHIELETEDVAVMAVITERFSMVRGDDHHRVFEEPLTAQVVEQATELLVEKRDAIVVAVAGHLDVPLLQQLLIDQHVIEEVMVILRSPGPDPEPALIIRRRYVRRMGIKIVQEGEEWAVPAPPAQPAEEGFGGPPRAARLQLDPLLIVIIARIQEVLHDPPPGDRAC